MTHGAATLGPVLIATPLTEGSERWVRRAVEMARAAGARPLLVHCVDPLAADLGEAPETEAAADSLEEDVGRELEAQAARCATARHGVECRLVVEVPHRGIARLAEEEGVGLVVVGAHAGESVLAKLLGSTADRVVRRAGVPVLVVRHDLAAAPRHVLVPVDLSSASEAAMVRGLELLAAVAIEPVEGEILYALGPLERRLHPGEPADVATQLERRLAALAASALPRGADIELRPRVVEGDPKRCILDAARRLAADWVVLGTHGRGGFERFLVGSVAAAVVREAPCSVLVVPPAKGREGSPGS